ncbi:MAG: caspase family protein [Treponema sp.]|jgi:hypothetical protein|nr:caspase family protein [Treponema sp.]
MKRIAIIISAPGGYDRRTERFEGIENDVDNWKNFLSSNIGGAWEEDEEEIIVINDPTPDDIRCLHILVQTEGYDFIFLTFSGHGGHDNTTKRNAYYINNKVIPENDLIFNCKRQLTVFDACRESVDNIFLECFSEESTTMIKSSALLRETNIRQKYKKAYNDAILRLPNMEERLYSCSIGETAADIGTGGLFTLNLINAVKTISNSQTGIITTNRAFMKAKEDTINTRRLQNPRCTLSRTPFPIGISLSLGIYL